MKSRILRSVLLAWAVFLAGSCLAWYYLDELFLPVMALLSLLPLLVFYLKLYRPLIRIIRTTGRYASGDVHADPLSQPENELGNLSASINFLAHTVHTSGESQRKFISNISHDFRSPLTSIKGYVEAILDGTIPVEMQDKYLEIVLGETERLNKLTEGLLTLNSFDDQGVYLELADFDLVPVIHHTIDTFEGISQKKNLHIKASFYASSVMVNADVSRIQQVLYNLLDNAIKFSYNNSMILIRVYEQRSRIYVSVKDHGEGISRENLPKIWERFYKTDASRGKYKKGTGLGLSIVREIIRAHDQTIDVISTEGVGTEFIFTLKKGTA
jgi:signal transduction histidine kinase